MRWVIGGVWLAGLLMGCAATPSPSAEGDAPVSAACAAPVGSSTQNVVDSANAQPPWVEIRLTVMLDEPGPAEADIRAWLRKTGAREIAIDPISPFVYVQAIVPALHVPEISCWPDVTNVESGNNRTCAPEFCLDPCLALPACARECSPLTGDRLDLSHGCVTHGVPLACPAAPPPASDEPAGVLTCYVRNDTGEVMVVRDDSLIDLGDKNLRTCTRAEGGTRSPELLPACP